MNRDLYERRKAGIKELKRRAGEELDRIRRDGGSQLEYSKAVHRYTEIRDYLREFIRKNTAPPGGSWIIRNLKQ